MYIPKRYGQSKTFQCPFCDKLGIAKSKQGLNVCPDHKNKELPPIKCVCGSYLEIRTGKYGPYFNCINCGNINLKKGLEMNKMKKEKVKMIKETEKKDVLSDGKYPGFDYGID